MRGNIGVHKAEFKLMEAFNLLEFYCTPPYQLVNVQVTVHRYKFL